jgi:Domain of unknown function (DUF4440)
MGRSWPAAVSLGLALIASACPAYATDASLQAQLTARAQARLDAIAVGNRVPWENDLDPNALLVDEEGNVTTKREFLAALKPLPKGSTGMLRVTHPRFAQTGNVAILTFIADENETIFAQHFHADFSMTDTYHESNGKWLLLTDTQTRLAQEPPTVTPTSGQMQSVAGDYRMAGGPTVFSVTIVNGVLFGGRAGTTPLRMYAIADQPGQYFRKHHPETLIFVPGAGGLASKLIDRRYYNRDMIYERVKS